MNRTSLEKITASVAMILTIVGALSAIMMVANTMFSWDLFAPPVESALYFLIWSSLIMFFASLLINVMLNFGRIAEYTGQIAHRSEHTNAVSDRQKVSR